MTYTAIDLFSGAGGLSLGLEAAGFTSVFAVEIDGDAAETYSACFPQAEVCRGDIRSIDFTPWRGVDLVAGGPPCQPFSIGGLRRASDDHRDLLPEFVRAVLEVRPKAFVLENVPGLIGFGDYLAAVLAPLKEIYRLSGPRLMNAADHGVPQARRRMILVGAYDGASIELPDATQGHMPAGLVLSGATVGDPNPSKIVYAKTPDLRPNPYHGQLFNGGGRPIELSRPAPTILASAGGNKTHFLDLENRVPAYHAHLARGGKPRIGELPGARRLTVLESASLQSFPKGMSFAGPRSSQYRQIGNAVPPKLAEAIGVTLAETVYRKRSSRKRMAA